MKKIYRFAKKHLSNLLFSRKYKRKFDKQDFHVSFKCDNFENFEFGRKCYIGPHCHFDALGGITLEDYVIVAPHVKIWSYNHDFKHEMVPYGPRNICDPVTIGKGVWLGLQSIILPGTVIGEGSIVGAGAVVKGFVEPYSIVRPNYSVAEPLLLSKNSKIFYQEFK